MLTGGRLEELDGFKTDKQLNVLVHMHTRSLLRSFFYFKDKKCKTLLYKQDFILKELSMGKITTQAEVGQNVIFLAVSLDLFHCLPP